MGQDEQASQLSSCGSASASLLIDLAVDRTAVDRPYQPEQFRFEGKQTISATRRFGSVHGERYFLQRSVPIIALDR